MPINIAIAEDNALALQAVIEKLSVYPEIRIKLIAENGEDLIKKISDQNINIVLMDIEMPVMDGIQATPLIKGKHPQIKVLALTIFDDDDKIFEIIMAGACGYLLKEENGEYIYQALINTQKGGAAISPSIALKVLNLIRQPLALTQKSSYDFNLTQREKELLEQLKNGLTYEEIALNLHISHGTVRKHIENIYRKLHVNNKVGAIQVAMENRL